MALSKITLTLGKGKSKQKISLTPEQFEELKQDMRDLDQSHNYYWNQNTWYQPWYTLSSTTYSASTTRSSNVEAVSSFTVTGYDRDSKMRYLAQCKSPDPEASPPSFQGKVLSTRC